MTKRPVDATEAQNDRLESGCASSRMSRLELACPVACPWATDGCMRHFWPQDARRPLERPTSLLTAPSGPETVLSRNRRRSCRLVMLHGPGCIPLHETCPGTHRRHARCALHKQASSETHTHTLTAPQSHVAQKPRSRHRSTSTSALHCTAHPPTLSYTRPEEASGREGERGARLSAAAESRRALPRVPAFRALASSAPALPAHPWARPHSHGGGRRPVAGGISFRLGHVRPSKEQIPAGHWKVDTHHHAALVASTTKSPRHMSRE